MLHTLATTTNRSAQLRAGLLLLVTTLLLLVASPADAAVTYSATGQRAVVAERAVHLTVNLRASTKTTVKKFDMCVQDTATRQTRPTEPTRVVLRPSGTKVTMSKQLPIGKYRYWACGRVGTKWRALSPTRTFAVTSTRAPVGIPGTWRPVFDDNFDGTSLNTRLWSKGWFGDGITQPVNEFAPGCYDPARVAVRNGSLNISLVAKEQFCGGRNRPWSTGLISSNGKFEYTYGASEARIFLPDDGSGRPANWPAFWADGQNWPVDGENDVMEAMAGEVSSHFHSSAGGPGFTVPGKWTGWHTFGSRWEPGKVTYYYDGREVGSITTGITGAPMYLILNQNPSVGSRTVPATLRVDYVRVWQR